jgi:hypothetical protein
VARPAVASLGVCEWRCGGFAGDGLGSAQQRRHGGVAGCPGLSPMRVKTHPYGDDVVGVSNVMSFLKAKSCMSFMGLLRPGAYSDVRASQTRCFGVVGFRESTFSFVLFPSSFSPLWFVSGGKEKKVGGRISFEWRRREALVLVSVWWLASMAEQSSRGPDRCPNPTGLIL